VKRRAFIAALGGAAWPLVARAQQAERVRRIGVLMNVGADDPHESAATFTRELQRLNWTDGRNVRVDTRWAAGDAEQFRRYASDLVALQPDVILAVTTAAVMSLRQATRTIPIVFVAVVDPLGSGLVASLARPGGNATGFTLFEYSIGAKWLELLKEIAPRIARVAILRDSTIATGIGQFAAIQAMAASTGMELSAIDVSEPSEIEPAVATFAHALSGGMIVTPSSFGANHPDVIAALAAKYKLPAVYPFRYFVSANGLISYGPVIIDQFRRAAGYVDRILKGEKPADLPVQAPTKYELVINLKTAKALGLTVPPSLLARADEVIE
jgi:putative tryptophan/tyrosine transport system substrate-binding protein